MLSDTFRREVDGIDGLLDSLDSRLQSLHDLAIYEELPAAVPRRISNRRNALELFRSQLSELPELAGGN